MINKSQKVIALLFIFVLTLTFIPAFAEKTNIADDVEEVTVLDIKKKFNPLRCQQKSEVEMEKDSSNNERDIEFDDEDVIIEKVTYYDERGNIISEYRDEEALQHLYDTENEDPSIPVEEKTAKEVSKIQLNSRNSFNTRVVSSFVNSKARSKIIRKKPLNLSDFNSGKFLFEAGLSFIKPVQSILYAAVSQFLPSSTRYKAGDVNQTQIYRFYQKTAQLKLKKPASKWFSPVIVEKREVDLTGTYYITSSSGKLSKFYSDFGRVEMNYNPVYNSSSKFLIDTALATYNSYPYVRRYSWNKKLWPYNGKTRKYNNRVRTVMTN